MTPREQPAGVKALQRRIEQTHSSEERIGNRARSAIQGQLFERAPASNWSSSESILSTTRFNLILNAVCDFKDDELKYSK